MGNNDFSLKSEIGDPKIEYSNYFPINSQGSKALWYLWVWMAHSHEKWDLSKRLWTSLTDNHYSCLLMQLNRNMVIENLSIFGFKPKFWTIPTANMTYVRSQNYTNMEVGEHRIQTFKVVVVVSLLVMLFDVFVPISAHPFLICQEEWFVQIYLNVSWWLNVEFKGFIQRLDALIGIILQR